MTPEAALKRPLRPQTRWFCPARQDGTSILQVRLEPAGRGSREDSLRAWVPGPWSGMDALGPRDQAAALLPAAGPSSVAAGPWPRVYFCLLLLPSMAFLLGGPPCPIGVRGLSSGAECGYTPPSSRRSLTLSAWQSTSSALSRVYTGPGVRGWYLALLALWRPDWVVVSAGFP